MPSSTPRSPALRRVLLAGATGLVGGHLLKGLLGDDSVREVHVVGRRAPACEHPKLCVHHIDFRALPALPGVDEVYLALGTTIKAAGSREAFRAVDYDANLAVARAALQAGARRLGLVSALGAQTGSRVFYNRVKGELEEAILSLPTEATVIARPSLLLGDRTSLGQPSRPGENLAKVLFGALRFVTPAKYRPIHAAAVAQALLAKVPQHTGALILSSAELQALGQ